MKTESATFITETSQVNQDNIDISMQQKTLRINVRFLYSPTYAVLSDVHKPALTGGCSQMFVTSFLKRWHVSYI